MREVVGKAAAPAVRRMKVLRESVTVRPSHFDEVTSCPHRAKWACRDVLRSISTEVKRSATSDPSWCYARRYAVRSGQNGRPLRTLGEETWQITDRSPLCRKCKGA